MTPSGMTLEHVSGSNQETIYLYTLVSVVSPKAQFLALYIILFVMYTTALSTLISSISLNHHLYADDTQLFLSFHPSEFHSNITHLQNALQQI